MKKVTLFVAAAALIALGSAFTMKSDSNVKSSEVCYLNSAGQYKVKNTAGTCATQADSFCTYIYVGSGVAGLDQNAANYQADPSTAGTRWIP